MARKTGGGAPLSWRETLCVKGRFLKKRKASDWLFEKWEMAADPWRGVPAGTKQKRP